MSLAPFLSKINDCADLTASETTAAFDLIFEGAATPGNIADFLLGLKNKGETVDELLGAVKSMRGKMLAIKAPPNAMDIVGTGGDAHGTLNISTAVALVVASCGVPVAKHGNRAATSKSGSSDVLTALGVHLEPPLSILEKCLAEANLCFLLAPRHHPAMRHVAEIRKKLGVRTLFNLLGPLTNPANVKRHLIGVYALDWLGPMAEVLKLLESDAAWIAHGHDGMDEITTTDSTDIIELRGNRITHFTLEPHQVGLTKANLTDLKGSGAAENAQQLIYLLGGEKGAYRDIVLFNTSGALIVAGKAADLKQGIEMAAYAIDNGAARRTLDHLIRLTNEKATV